MKSKYTLLYVILITVLCITACGTAQGEQQAQTVAREYLVKLYTISDYTALSSSADQVAAVQNTYKPLFTQQGFGRFIANRTPFLIIDAATRGKFNLHLSDVTFKTVTLAKDKAVFDYKFTLQADYAQSREQKCSKQIGQITALNEHGIWKIDNDHPEFNDFFWQ